MYVDSLFDKNNLQHICCKVRNPEAFISDAIILIVYANDDTDKLLLLTVLWPTDLSLSIS